MGIGKDTSERLNLDQDYSVTIQQTGEWWIGWNEEVPGVNCQERMRDGLLDSLRITLAEAIEFDTLT